MEKTYILIICIILLFLMKFIINTFFHQNFFLTKFKNFILLVPVMIHEVCHLIGSIITGGKPKKLIINKDLSGEALFSGGKFSNFFGILVGYPGTSLFALGTTYTYLNYDVYITLGIFIGFSVIATIFMRSKFTFLWMLLFNITLTALLYFDIQWIIVLLMGIFIAACIMESLTSSFTLLKINLKSFKTKEEVGDATFLKRITKIPAIFWSTFFVVFSVYIFIETMYLIVK